MRKLEIARGARLANGAPATIFAPPGTTARRPPYSLDGGETDALSTSATNAIASEADSTTIGKNREMSARVKSH